MQQESEHQTPSKSTNNQQIVAYGSQEFHKEHNNARIVNFDQFFSSTLRQVYQIACGGLHTLILTTNGEVYSFGNKKDGALGRTGNPNQPAKVELGVPVDMICAGESHSIACNSNNAIIYQWGRYNYFNTKESLGTILPQRIGENDIKKKKIKKIISGANHTLALAEGKVFVWGEGEWGILGRLPSSRRKTDQGLKVETLGVRGPVEDIFTGANHAFLKKTETKKKETHNVILGWGYNISGQLGIGSREQKIFNPTEVEALRDKNIENITGGKHHTLVLTSEGEVFSFGRNDEGQLGLGKYFKLPTEEPEELAESETKTTTTPKAKASPNEEKKEETLAAPENEEKSEAEGGQKHEERITWLVWTPQKVELTNVAKIFSGTDSNYAITKDHGVYCWGSAEDNLLGPGQTESLYVPTKLGGDLYNSKPIRQIGLGKEHVVLLAGDTEVQLEEHVINQEIGKSAKKVTTGKKGQKKGKPEEETEDVKKTLEEEKPAEVGKTQVKKSGKKKSPEDEDEDGHETKKVKLTPTNEEKAAMIEEQPVPKETQEESGEKQNE